MVSRGSPDQVSVCAGDDEYATRIDAMAAIEGRPDREIGDSVVVDVAQRCESMPESRRRS
jgi:hypothetical protein